MEIKMKYRLTIIMILMLAVASRAIGIGVYPVGIHADEAYAGYEAYSMLMDGTDSWGYHNPVYLTVWGSGMSVLESLLMMPFIRLGGLNLAMVRMPQMLLGMLSVLLLYLMVKRISNQRMALWAGFLLAVCPWHIMMSRWGLDANLAPAFILFAMYFSVLGLEKEQYFILAALFWGASLYTYTLTWIFVPVFLICSFIFCARYRKLPCSKYVCISVLVLGLMALPLMLFVAVNKGFLPEIITPYFSVPKMAEFRSDGLRLSGIGENLRDFLRIYIKQNDMNRMNTIPYFGLYYLFSLPFMVLGGWNCLSGTIQNIKAIAKIAHDYNILFHTDAVQAIGVMKIDVQDMEIDLLSISSHKIHGPKGVGALYVKNGVRIDPIQFGGNSQERGKRAGTENVPGIAGFGKAIEITSRNCIINNKKLKNIRDYFLQRLEEKVEFFQVNGHPHQKSNAILNVSFYGIEGESILMLLDLAGICVSTSSACTSKSLLPSHVLKAMGIPDEIAQGSIRISFGTNISKSDVDFVVDEIQKVVAKLRAISPIQAGRM